MHPASLAPEQLLAQCREVRTRRPGPGGQNRNKVETAVILTHVGTGLHAEANERRSQAENRSAALFRLRLLLALHVRDAESRRQTSELWRQRCVNCRIRVNPEHGDFPTLLAEALDVLSGFDYDVKRAADHLAITTSQLLKFLKLEPRAFVQFNLHRAERGLPKML